MNIFSDVRQREAVNMLRAMASKIISTNGRHFVSCNASSGGYYELERW